MMSIEAGELQQQVMAAIQAQSGLVVTEPRIEKAHSLLDAVSTDYLETVNIYAAPEKPTKSVEVLNEYYRSIDAIVAPTSEGTDARRFSNGMHNGRRRYVEQVGVGQLTYEGVTEEVELERLIFLRIFPNARLAYDVSRGEDLGFISHYRRRISEKDLKRFGNAAVTRV